MIKIFKKTHHSSVFDLNETTGRVEETTATPLSPSAAFNLDPTEGDASYDKDSANANISAFINYISGAEIAIYNEFMGMGRQKCWVVEHSIADKIYRDTNKDILEFDIKFKCNDPMTNIILAV